MSEKLLPGTDMRPAERLLRFGIEHGLDMFLIFQTKRCPRGAPADVLKQYPVSLPIRLAGTRIAQYQLRFTKRGVSMLLCFGDRVGRSYFPWWSLRSVTFDGLP